MTLLISSCWLWVNVNEGGVAFLNYCCCVCFFPLYGKKRVEFRQETVKNVAFRVLLESRLLAQSTRFQFVSFVLLSSEIVLSHFSRPNNCVDWCL